MHSLGFSLQADYGAPITDVISMLQGAGFSAVSPLWSPELDLDGIANRVCSLGMTIQSLHAPHKGISLLWKPDAPEASSVYQNILRSIDACARYDVPIMVIHGWQGLIYTFPETPLDFRFFDDIVEHARQAGISIAFENLEGEEYLEALMTRYQALSHVGYCWDSGHDHCYPHRTDFLAKYGSRLIMTHLNDNWGLRDPGGIPSGNDDLHFLPYDGNLDWEKALRRLQTAKPQNILNFEIKRRSHSVAPRDLPYLQLSLERFIDLSGTRAGQIAKKFFDLSHMTEVSP